MFSKTAIDKHLSSIVLASKVEKKAHKKYFVVKQKHISMDTAKDFCSIVQGTVLLIPKHVYFLTIKIAKMESTIQENFILAIFIVQRNMFWTEMCPV